MCFRSITSLNTSRILEESSNETITYLCPEYNIQEVAVRKPEIITTLEKFRGENLFLKFMEEGEMDWPQLMIRLVPVFSIYIVLFLVGVIAVFGCFFAWSCTFIFHKCGDKYDTCELPRRRGSNASSVCIVTLLCILMVGTGLVGAMRHSNFFNRIDAASCIVTNLVTEVAEGKAHPNWMGMTHFISNLELIRQEVIYTTTSLPSLNDSTQLNIQRNNLFIDLDTRVYADNENLQVGTPNPVAPKAVKPTIIKVNKISLSFLIGRCLAQLQIKQRILVKLKRKSRKKPIIFILVVIKLLNEKSRNKKI